MSQFSPHVAPPLRRRRLLWTGVAFALLGSGAAWAIRSSGAQEATAAPAKGAAGGSEVPVLDGRFIRFSKGFVARNGIAASPVQSKELTPFVSVSGAVTYDSRRFAAVGARIPGRVRRVFKVTGDEVKPNQPLAEIESADLGRAEALVASARAKESAAEAQMKRERKLADARISAERDAELAKAEYEAARAERIASERAVAALGGDLEGEIGILTLRSPVAGKVVAGKAVRGQTVDPKDTLFEVADLGTLWVELRLFERDLASVRVGDVVELAAPAAGGREIKGTVQHVGDVVDVETRTAAVRIVVDNRERALRPGQAVHARIHTRSPAGRQVAVPRGAVTRVDGRPTVFVMIDGETVEPRTVKLGAEDHDEVAILEGVRQGEKVVTGGLFALKSEIFR